MNWEEIASRIVAKRGCLICGMSYSSEVGDIHRKVRVMGGKVIGHPFRIVREATEKEWHDQCRLLDRLLGREPIPEDYRRRYTHFYVIETD